MTSPDPSEREAELQLALADLIAQARQAAFWLQKTEPEGRRRYESLMKSVREAEETLSGAP